MGFEADSEGSGGEASHPERVHPLNAGKEIKLAQLIFDDQITYPFSSEAMTS